ncbi:MAG: hypothetical protein II911_05865, partial [Clostridia bacterium]|nr:hypothetical protein [Clostridia bacterium]
GHPGLRPRKERDSEFPPSDGLLRVVLMYVLIHAFGTVEALVIVYPITWFTEAVSMAVLYIAKTKKLKKGEESYETQIA